MNNLDEMEDGYCFTCGKSMRVPKDRAMNCVECHKINPCMDEDPYKNQQNNIKSHIVNTIKIVIFDDRVNKTVQEIQINIDYKENIKFGNFRIGNSIVRIPEKVIEHIRCLNFKNAEIQFISVMIGKKVTAIPEIWNKDKLIQYLKKFIIE
jgi:hypothetical protein